MLAVVAEIFIVHNVLSLGGGNIVRCCLDSSVLTLVLIILCKICTNIRSSVHGGGNIGNFQAGYSLPWHRLVYNFEA